MTSLFVINLVSTLFMAGVIWFVQIVHYPLFKRASRRLFCDYITGHSRRTGLLVIPAMLAELISAILLLNQTPTFMTLEQAQIGIVLLVGVWLSTFLVQVPLHRKLRDGYNATAVRALVLTNWIRTILWTARAALLVWVLTVALQN